MGNFSELLGIYSGRDTTGAQCSPAVFSSGSPKVDGPEKMKLPANPYWGSTMKNANAEVAATEFAPLSDAEIAAALADSPWAKMERDAKHIAAAEEPLEEDKGQQDRCA
jgi:hypothetical protein